LIINFDFIDFKGTEALAITAVPNWGYVAAFITKACFVIKGLSMVIMINWAKSVIIRIIVT